MEYIRVTNDNLEKEHICCAISNNKDVQVSSKKSWQADRFDEGLVFLKSVERGKERSYVEQKTESYYKDPKDNIAFERCIEVMSRLIMKYGPGLLEKMDREKLKDLISAEIVLDICEDVKV